MMVRPFVSVSKSRLREPKVADLAQHEPVEIHMGADEANLVLFPKSAWLALHELNDLCRTLIAVMTASRMREPVPAALLGDAAFITDWSNADKELFYEGFMAALAESLRIGDPTPARAFLDLMAQPDIEQHSPTLSGAITGRAATVAAARFGHRDP